MTSPKHRKPLATIAVLVVAAGLLAYGIWGLVQHYRATHNSQSTRTETAERPGETPPKTCEDYPVATSEPRRIELPRIGASGCVQKVGTDKSNAIGAPTNVHVAGWYTNSPVPGQPGISIVDGHVSGRYSDGIFAKLGRSRPGDIIKIKLGSGQERQFVVVDVATYPVNEAASKLLQPLKGVTNQLTLITCGGTFDRKAETYDARVIVRAKNLDQQ